MATQHFSCFRVCVGGRDPGALGRLHIFVHPEERAELGQWQQRAANKTLTQPTELVAVQ